MQSQKFKSIMKLFCDSKCVTFFLSLLLSKNQIKNTLGVTSIKINGCQKNAIPIQSVESTAQKSMHWWHRIVIYCIGFRSILQMNAAWICVCLCMLCVRAKDIECKQKCRRTIVQIKVVAFFLVFGCYAALCCMLRNRNRNRMCNIRDRNHIVCIILILFCVSFILSLTPDSLFGCFWF